MVAAPAVERMQTNNGRTLSSPPVVVCSCAKRVCCILRFRSGQVPCLLGGEFFLFAFHAHLLELALFGFDRRRNFLLDLGCRFFKLR